MKRTIASAALAIALVAPAVLTVRGSWMWITPAVLAWAFSPVVAWSISRPLRRREAAGRCSAWTCR